MSKPTINSIEAVLPQTQCRECGYPSCNAYARAICNDAESIGRCAPGGENTLLKLAQLTQQDPAAYHAQVAANYRAPAVAAIIEQECIGCTKCIQACPVDAIIGAAKQMHTILTAECTGCGLCVAPCPVDCITLTPLAQANYNREVAQQRYNARQSRLSFSQTRDQSIATPKADDIQAALARVAARKSS